MLLGVTLSHLLETGFEFDELPALFLGLDLAGRCGAVKRRLAPALLGRTTSISTWFGSGASGSGTDATTSGSSGEQPLIRAPHDDQARAHEKESTPAHIGEIETRRRRGFFSLRNAAPWEDSPMPWKHDPNMQSLRLTYNAAVTAHAEHARALTEALIRSETAPAELIEAEAQARHQKEMARRQLHAAMARNLGPPTEPPGPPSDDE